MVLVRGALSGTHPMSEDLIQVILDHKYGRSDKSPIQSLFQKELTNLLDVQKHSSFPILSTGSLGVEDLLRPFTRSLTSLHSYEEIGDLPIVRWHYTNTFYRQASLITKLPTNPVVISTDQHSLTEENTYNLENYSDTKFRVVLPGPYSFASLINLDNNPYRDVNELIIELGNYLGKEAQQLRENIVEIQFDEPSLVWQSVPRDLRPSIHQAYNTIRKELSGKNIIVNTFFESASSILPFLLDLPIDGLGIDFIETNILSLTDYSFSEKILQAGVLDSKNYVPKHNVTEHNNQFLAKFIYDLVELDPKEIIVSSPFGFEYLPKEVADGKIIQISDIVNKTQELLS